MTLFKGAGTALVTPFTKDDHVDFQALEKLIDRQIENGIDALISCGTTGEASTLKDEEHIQTVRATVSHVNKRIPVIAGAGSNDTSHAVELSVELERSGVDGLLLVTPYYNKCTEKGLIKHYEKIADAVSIPVLLYSVPGRTCVNISPFIVSILSKHPNIAGIKEASGNIAQVSEICKYISPDFNVYSGNDDMIIPVLSLGGVGAVSTVSNIIPKVMHDMISSWFSGDTLKAARMQLSFKELIDAMFIEVNPVPVKAALNMMGLIENVYRLPLSSPENKSLYKIMSTLKTYGLINCS